MDRADPPVVLGFLASVLTVLLAVAPYAVPGIDPGGVETYYDFGVLGGWSVLIVAAVAAVVFVSAATGRADAPTAAGAGLIFGVAAALLAVYWFVSVPYAVVVQLETAAWFAYHRWALLVTALAIPAFGLWFTLEQHLF